MQLLIGPTNKHSRAFKGKQIPQRYKSFCEIRQDDQREISQ